MVLLAAIVVTGITGIALFSSGYASHSVATNSTSISTTSVTSTTNTSISTSYYSTSLSTTTEYGHAIATFGNGQTAPSAIFIPANTLVWVNMVYPQNTSYALSAAFTIYLFTDDSNVNMTTAVYGSNGALLLNSSYTMPDFCNPTCVKGIGPDPNSNATSNQVISIANNTLSSDFPAQANKLTLSQGSVFSVAFVADHSIWVTGWTTADRSMGTGPAYGQSSFQLPNTYEASSTYTMVPASLPQPSVTLSFESSVFCYTIVDSS